MNDARRALGLRVLLAQSFLAGMAVMIGEIAAGRLLAPYLGTSTTTWALLIGTVLGSLAVGSLVGGALSARGSAASWIVKSSIAGAILFSTLPRFVPLLLSSSLGRFRSGNTSALALTALVTALAIALPMISLGAVPPLLMQVAGQHQQATPGVLGKLSGRLTALGTLGSLAGTFSTGLLLLPWIGTRATFDLAAALLCLGALWFGLRAGARRDAAMAFVTLLFSLLLAFLVRPSPASRLGRVVWSGESRHNHLTVLEKGGERQLRVNDGFAVQSFTRLDGRLPLRDVWTFYALAPSFGKTAAPRNVLLLGLGGGTAAEIYRRIHPQANVVGVELDEGIVNAGKTWLKVNFEGVEVIVDDARTYVDREALRAPGRFEVIILDAFQFPYVPFQLATVEFFDAVRRNLAPGGVLMVNAGRYGEGRDVVYALARSMKHVFAHVQAADAPNQSNTILVATDHAPAEAIGLSKLSISEASAKALKEASAGHAPMQPAQWPESTPLLTDDHAPVEWLTDRIIWRAL